SLLTFWPLPTTACLSVDMVLPLAAEGTDVLLLAHNVTENSLGYAWYRGERVENIQLIASYRTLYPNGTLLIQNVTQKDTGSYTLLVTNDDLQTERQTGHLCIYRQENSPALNNEIIIAIMTGILVRLTLVTTLGCFVFLKMTRRASGQNDLREQQPPAATLGHGPLAAVSPGWSLLRRNDSPPALLMPTFSPAQASLLSPRPIVPLYEELLYPNTDIYCQIHPEVDVVS
ncbi:hypothetical protein FD755_003971, partial [Muntiacus reevesi]